MDEAKERLSQIEQELMRERFGLERFRAQCARWQQELEDLDNTGFFSFLVDVESKKVEARATLQETQSQLETAETNIARLEAEAARLRENVPDGTAGAYSDGTAGADSDGTAGADFADGARGAATSAGTDSGANDVYSDEVHNEACNLLRKIEKAIGVSKMAVQESLSSLSSSRALAIATSGRKSSRLLGGVRRAQADGSNIEMALEVVRDRVDELEKLLTPLLNRAKEKASGEQLNNLKLFHDHLLTMKNSALSVSAPLSYTGSGLSAAFDFNFEHAAGDTTKHLGTLELSAMYVKEALERGILDED